jgi:hypothetical protein
MTEIRRVKMKFGDAEFEADVPEDRIQPMYDRFIFTLERRGRAPQRPANGASKAFAGVSMLPADPSATGLTSALTDVAEPLVSPAESSDHKLLRRLFDLRHDGVVTLRVLPRGAGRGAEALLLLLYGYRRLKHEEGVLATRLHRAAEQSGVSIRWPAYELATYDRFISRIGRRKGSTYSLNDQGLAMAQEISSMMLAATLIEDQTRNSALGSAAASSAGSATGASTFAPTSR